MFDRVAELEESMADIRLALAEDMSGSERAALLREKRITLAELASLAGVEKGSTIDELAGRREDRRAAAGVASKSKRGRK